MRTKQRYADEKKNVLLVLALYNLPFYTDFLWLTLPLLIIIRCTVKPFLGYAKMPLFE